MSSLTSILYPLRRDKHIMRDSESGITLVELLIAITMLAIIVAFSSNLFISSFRKNANMENRNKATQIANEVIAIAKQSPYKRLYTPTQQAPTELFEMNNGSMVEKCEPDPRTVVNATKYGGYLVTQPDDYSNDTSFDKFREFKGLKYCEKTWFGQEEADQVGTTFYVQTDIIYLSDEANDMPSRAEAGNPEASEEIRAKRVVVTVRWRDTESGEDGSPNKVTAQTTIAPKLWDCPATTASASVPNTKNARDEGLYGCQHQ